MASICPSVDLILTYADCSTTNTVIWRFGHERAAVINRNTGHIVFVSLISNIFKFEFLLVYSEIYFSKESQMFQKLSKINTHDAIGCVGFTISFWFKNIFPLLSLHRLGCTVSNWREISSFQTWNEFICHMVYRDESDWMHLQITNCRSRRTRRYKLCEGNVSCWSLLPSNWQHLKDVYNISSNQPDKLNRSTTAWVTLATVATLSVSIRSKTME